MIPIVPAFIPLSLTKARDILADLRFSPEVHLDVVDGKFVPFSSWPCLPAGEPADIRDLTDQYTLEVDLMVEEPWRLGESFMLAGADMLVFHVETIDLADFKSVAASFSTSINISLGNNTPLTVLSPYLAWADGIQLMGIAEIGSQGQPFDERVIDRIKELKATFPQLPITVDGSVNLQTIARLKEAGVDRLIVGSAVVGVKDKEVAYRELLAVANLPNTPSN